MKTRSHVAVEFTDRLGDYWEVLPIHHRPGTVLGRLQKLLATAERSPSFQAVNLNVLVTKASFIVEFDKGDYRDAEALATLLAWELGWREADGVLVGRVGRPRT